MAWPTRKIQRPVMVPGILRRPARGMGFLPSDSGGDSGGWADDWSWFWDQFPVDWGSNPREMIFDFPPIYGPETGATTAPLPGYCPPGTYHPISDPYACVPFPGSTTGQPAPKRATPAQRPGVTRPKPTAAGQCPPPFVYDPKQKKCVLPPCPPGQAYSLTQRKCVPVAQLKPADQVNDEAFPWWLVIAGGAVLIALTSGRRR